MSDKLRMISCLRTPIILQTFAIRTAVLLAHVCCPVRCQCICACEHAIYTAAVRELITKATEVERCW